MTESYRIDLLGPEHDRAAFACGVDALDRYLRENVTQDVRRRVTTCYVAVDESTGQVAGYYTLAAAGVLLANLPDHLTKRLPRYPPVPVARLGRPAVALSHRGRGLGGGLLADVIGRSARSEIAVFALIVDAKDDQAEAFYQHHGFINLVGQTRQLILPLAKSQGQK